MCFHGYEINGDLQVVFDVNGDEVLQYTTPKGSHWRVNCSEYEELELSEIQEGRTPEKDEVSPYEAWLISTILGK